MDTKQSNNFLLAVVLSMIVVALWSYFVAWPRAQQEQLRREMVAKQTASQTQTVPAQPGTPAVPGAAVPAGNPALPALNVFATRELALAATPRIEIDAPSVKGSISLKGARFDDVVFKNYHEKVDPSSPNVVMLSPEGYQGGYHAQFDWVDAAGLPLTGPATQWQVPVGARLVAGTPVTLSADLGSGLAIKRTISIDDKYMFTVKDEIVNGSGKDVALRPAAMLSRHGEPHVTNETIEGYISGSPIARVDYMYYYELKTTAGREHKDTGGWLGFTDKYWAATLIPPQDLAYTTNLSRAPDPNPVYRTGYQVDAPIVVKAGETKAVESRLFAGAKEVLTVEAYESKGIPLFSYMHDWGWFWYLTKPMFYLIDWLYKGVGAFWAAMLLVTVLVKAAFYPLANMSFSSMAKMKKLQPEMVKIQERFKDDKVRQQQATMELYKTAGVNPMIGCLPVLLQIPVFFALYKVLYTTLEMRHQPFFGWIQDLSAPDPTNLFNLFGLLPYTIPQTIPFLHLGVWPIIMGITMWVQMKLNPPPPDPVQARMFMLMPIIFTFMLGTMPAGLVIYWAWNNSLTIAQQAMIMKRQGVPVDLGENILKSLRDAWTFVSGLISRRATTKP